MNQAARLFALRQMSGDGGTGGAGSSGGAGASGPTPEDRVKELEEKLKIQEEKHGLEKQRLSAEAARHRVEANKVADRVKELEAEKAKGASGGGSDATGQIPKEVELRFKAIEDENARLKATMEQKDKAALEKERASLRDALISERIAFAGVIADAQEMVRSYVEKHTVIEDDGSVIFKAKDLKGEAREIPLRDLDIREFAHAGSFPAKAGGGSGGRTPVGAGGGKSDDVLRDIPVSEWIKMTPEQRRALQTKRMEAHGVRTR